MARHAIRALPFLLAFVLSGPFVAAEVVRMEWVPNRMLPQGQVQVLREDPVVSVLVVLDTRFLDRVVSAIIEKEQRNWPADHPDAQAYIATLREAREDVRRESGGHGREALAIAFILDPAGGRVEWSTGPVFHTEQGHATLRQPRLLRRVYPSAAYLERNAALILEDSFGIPAEEARAWLAREDV